MHIVLLKCPDVQIGFLKFTSCDFSWVYSSCCCSCSFEAEILKIGQSSHKMYSNKILNFQESTTISNAHTKKKSGNLSCGPRIYIPIHNVTHAHTYIYAHAYIHLHKHTHMYTSIHKHKYTHVHIHTHTHTYIIHGNNDRKKNYN